MSKFQQYTAGFIIGSLAGGIIALLSTPISGKELRARCVDLKNRLLRSSREWKNDLTSFKNNIDLLQLESKKAMKTVGHDIKDAIYNWKEETDPVLRALKSDIEALREKAERVAKELNSSGG